MMSWESMSVDDMHRCLEVLHKQLWNMRLDGEKREVQIRVRGFVMSEFGEPDREPDEDAPWARWFPVVASTFAYAGDDGQLTAPLFGHVISAARVITGRAIPPGAPPFPGSDADRCWSGWDQVGTPPPIKRAGQPVMSPRCRQWLQPEYDVWQWDVMYDLLTRLEHLGRLSVLELHPIPGVDPEIVYPPDVAGYPAFDHDAVAVDNRPPMGLVVALLLARELAYFYAGELSCGAIGEWIFEVIAGKPLDPRSRPPRWLTATLEARVTALEPAAMLEFCERALRHLAEIAEGICGCDD